VVQEPEEVNQKFVRDFSYMDRLRFIFTFERGRSWKSLENLGDNALWYGVLAMGFLRDV
jgi:hypothetical protein